MTKGEARVRIEFNPSNDETVYKLKEAAAHFIDDCESLLSVRFDGDRYAERARLVALAQTAIEEAAMWAVKAATN
jgi:hypothetical protein